MIWFGCDQQTENGFVVDFGSLGGVKDWLEEKFDHTMLLDSDDPLLMIFDDSSRSGPVDWLFLTMWAWKARPVTYLTGWTLGSARKLMVELG